jgi:hypothetical protein
VKLILRVFHTFIDLVIIASFIAISVGTYWLIKELLSSIEPRRIRIFKRFAKTVGFSAERIPMGMWEALTWSVTFKRDQSFLGKPENKIRRRFVLSDFPEGLRGGVIAFPKSSKETIYERFHNSFPDDLYDAVFSVINSLITTPTQDQERGHNFLAFASIQALSFGLLLKVAWKDSLTKEIFDDDCYCLDVVGVNSEVLFFLVAELLTVFGQKAAIVKPEGFGGVWVLRRVPIYKSKEHK